MDRQRLDGWCERGILGLILAILIFGPLATGAVRPQDFLVILALAFLAGLLWVVRLWLNPDYRIRIPLLGWVVLLFAGYAVARYLTADIEYVARKELVRVLVYALLFFVLVNLSQLQRSADLIVFTLAVLGFGIAVYGLYQFFNNTDSVWHFIRPAAYAGRGSGTYICPNHLAGFLGMILPVALAHVLVGGSRKLIKVCLGYAALGIAAGIYATLSRGGMVASAAALCLLLVLLLRQRAYHFWAMLLLGTLILAGLLAELKTGYFEKRFKGFEVDDPSDQVTVRWMMWLPAVQMWDDHFWWGVGPAHFDYRFPAYRPARLQARPDRAHNDYLNTLADWGTMGAALVAGAWFVFYAGLFRYWRASRAASGELEIKSNNRNAFILGGAAGLFAILFHCAVEYNMHVPANALLAVTLLAIATGLLKVGDARKALPVWAGRVIATVLFLPLLAFLGQQIWVGGHEWIWLERATRAGNDARRQINALEKAFHADPLNFETAYALGELHRGLSWAGQEGYQEEARQAMRWFELSRGLNPHHAHSWLRYGMCLDWLGRQKEAAPYFKRAVELDPNGHHTAAHQGWHYVQTREWAKAKRWFNRSYELEWGNNRMAVSYLAILDRKIAEEKAERKAALEKKAGQAP